MLLLLQQHRVPYLPSLLASRLEFTLQLEQSSISTYRKLLVLRPSVFLPLLLFNHLLQCLAIELRSIISGNQCVHIEQSYWHTYHHHYHHHHIIDGLLHYHHCRASVSRAQRLEPLSS